MLRIKVTIGCDVDRVQCNEHFDSKWSTLRAPQEKPLGFDAQPDVMQTINYALAHGWHVEWDEDQRRMRWFCPNHTSRETPYHINAPDIVAGNSVFIIQPGHPYVNQVGTVKKVIDGERFYVELNQFAYSGWFDRDSLMEAQ